MQEKSENNLQHAFQSYVEDKFQSSQSRLNQVRQASNGLVIKKRMLSIFSFQQVLKNLHEL